MGAVEPKGRTVKRWIAECLVDVEEKSNLWVPCDFNDREHPTRHRDAQSAVREAITHAVAAGHVGASEVTVRRIYKPRVLEREEIVG